MKERYAGMDEGTVEQWLRTYEVIQPDLIDYLHLIKDELNECFRHSGHRLQAIQDRNGEPKSASSLRKKLERYKFGKLEEVRDLVGLRCVFYLESEMERALNDLAWNLKDLKWEKVDYKEERSSDSFNARFLTVRLADGHPYYMRFKDLRIEIQFTTVLYHAWNEVQHETIYKKQEELSEFDLESFNNLKDKFGEVMSAHLREASKRLDYLNEQANKLIKARQIFQNDNLEEIDKSEDLNHLYFALDALHHALQENGLKLPPNYDLIGLIERNIARVSEIPVRPMLCSGSEFRGKDDADVIEKCLDILNWAKHSDPIRVILILSDLWRKNDTIQPHVKKVLHELSRYDVGVIKVIGYAIQKEIIDYIGKCSLETLIDNAEFYLEILDDLLELRLEGAQRTDVHTFSIPIGPPPAHPSLKAIRENAVDCLIRMYQALSDAKLRLRTIKIIGTGKTLPFLPDGGGETYKEFVKGAAKKVFEFYGTIVNVCDFCELKEITGDIKEYGRYCSDGNNDSLATAIKQNGEFQVFRTFVGHLSEYFEPSIKVEEALTNRDNEISALVNQFDNPNSIIWRNRFERVFVAADLLGRDQCEGFCIFLRSIAKIKPDLVLAIDIPTLKKMDFFVYEILIGLEKGGHSQQLVEFADLLLALKLGLEPLGLALGDSEVLFEANYEKLKNLALEINSHEVLNGIIRGLARRQKWKPELVSDTITMLTRTCREQPQISWVRLLWINRKDFAKEVSENQCVQLLDLLGCVPDIDYDEIEVLCSFVENYPHLLIPFFEKRVLRPKTDTGDCYSPLLYNPDTKLKEYATKHGTNILPQLLDWFSSENHLLRISAPFLFKDLFDLSNESIQEVLFQCIESGGDRLKAVLSILQNSGGKSASHELCKKIVKSHSRDDEIIRTVMNHLLQVHIAWGEDGILRQMEANRDLVLSWDTNNNPKLNRFIKKFKRYANQLIAAEKERVEKQTAFDQMEYQDFKEGLK